MDLAPAGYDEPTRAGAPEGDGGLVGAARPQCRNVWKVFGPKPQRIVGSAMADLPRAELEPEPAASRPCATSRFDVASGELFVVMGLSGSGKSTLVRCLSPADRADGGRGAHRRRGRHRCQPERLRELRRDRVSMVFQHFGLLPHRRLLDNVAFGLEVQGKDKASRLTRAGDMLDLVGLGGLGDSYPDEL